MNRSVSWFVRRSDGHNRAASFLRRTHQKGKMTMSKMKWKLMLAGVFVACAFGGIVLRFAWATPPSAGHDHAHCNRGAGGTGLNGH